MVHFVHLVLGGQGIKPTFNSLAIFYRHWSKELSLSKLFLLIFCESFSHLDGLDVVMAVAVLEVIPAVAALAEEDVGVRRVQDRLYVQILDTAVTAGACKLRTF